MQNSTAKPSLRILLILWPLWGYVLITHTHTQKVIQVIAKDMNYEISYDVIDVVLLC